MDKDTAVELAKINAKLDVMAPHFAPKGTMEKLIHMRWEWNVLKGLFGVGWAWILAKTTAGK